MNYICVRVRDESKKVAGFKKVFSTRAQMRCVHAGMYAAVVVELGVQVCHRCMSLLHVFINIPNVNTKDVRGPVEPKALFFK